MNRYFHTVSHSVFLYNSQSIPDSSGRTIGRTITNNKRSLRLFIFVPQNHCRGTSPVIIHGIIATYSPHKIGQFVNIQTLGIIRSPAIYHHDVQRLFVFRQSYCRTGVCIAQICTYTADPVIKYTSFNLTAQTAQCLINIGFMFDNIAGNIDIHLSVFCHIDRKFMIGILPPIAQRISVFPKKMFRFN